MTPKTKWQPWKDYEVEPEILPIEGPPCSQCKYWKPTRKFCLDGVYSGVELCRRTEMFRDFSCYQERDDQQPKPVPKEPTSEQLDDCFEQMVADRSVTSKREIMSEEYFSRWWHQYTKKYRYFTLQVSVVDMAREAWNAAIDFIRKQQES